MSPPPVPERPPGGGRPNQPSSPEIQAADKELDRTPWTAPNQRRFDDPRRRQTNPGGVMVTKLPPVPEVPLDHAATVPASAHKAATQRAPTPVSVQAVRSDAPPSGRAEAREAILEAELAKARADVAELERRARVRAEADSPATFPPAVTPSAAPAPERPTKAPESVAGEGSAKALRGALTKLVLGLAALLALLGIPLTAYIQALTTQIERSNSQATQARTEAADAKAGNSKAKQEAAASKAELAAFKAYFREVMRLQGVEIAKQPGEPDAGDLKPVTPLCQAGKVCAGPQIIITVPP